MKYEKQLQQLLDEQAAVGRPAARTEPRSPDEIDKFLRGFGLSGPAVRQIRKEWMAERDRAWSKGYEAGQQDADGYWA